MKELKELKLAFVQKGDEEREAAKAKFQRDLRRQRGEPEPAEPRKLDSEESKIEETNRAPEEKMRLVEKLIAMKRK